MQLRLAQCFAVRNLLLDVRRYGQKGHSHAGTVLHNSQVPVLVLPCVLL